MKDGDGDGKEEMEQKGRNMKVEDRDGKEERLQMEESRKKEEGWRQGQTGGNGVDGRRKMKVEE